MSIEAGSQNLISIFDFRGGCSQCKGTAHTLNLGLDIVDSVGRLHLKGDSLARKGLDEDLHLDEGLWFFVS